MDDLGSFIRKRLDEDEAVAMAAASDAARLAGRANWASAAAMVTDAEDPDWAIADLSPYVDDECLARHIARHDPARVLREVAAKRALLAECVRSVERGDDGRAMAGAAIVHMAAAWSDHDGYRAALLVGLPAMGDQPPGHGEPS